VPFVHWLRPRYAEVDAQGVVFNAHWLTYFDEACTRFFDSLGFPPAVAFFRDFDLMIVKAVLEWQGPAGFDDAVAIEVVPARLGNTSLDVRYTATVEDRPVCVGTVTYVSVGPGTHDPVPIPDQLRRKLETASA
jgi:acyl-CoA thioester hydrolase